VHPIRSNARSTFEHTPRRPVSHVVALAGPSFHRFQPCTVAFMCVQTQLSRSNAYISAIERMACVRMQPYDLAAHKFSINRPLVYFIESSSFWAHFLEHFPLFRPCSAHLLVALYF
jgi:hypothetical protein